MANIIGSDDEEYFPPSADRDWLAFECSFRCLDWIGFYRLRHTAYFKRTLSRLQQYHDEFKINLQRQNARATECLEKGEGFSALHEWYAKWARSVRRGDKDMYSLTCDRKAIRTVLFGVWNNLTQLEPQVEQNDSSPLLDRELCCWMTSVCCLLLPFERAEALFTLRDNEDHGNYGKNWISKLPHHQATAEDRRLFRENQKRGPDQPGSMNKRFVQIYLFLHLNSLGDPKALPLMNRLITAEKSPRETDETAIIAALVDPPLNVLRPTGSAYVSPRDELHRMIEAANDMRYFVFLYRTETFLNYLRIIRLLQSNQKLGDFAKRWAANPYDYEILFEPVDLETILYAYHKLYLCLTDANNAFVTKETILQEFKPQSFTNVLGVALPMARELALNRRETWPPDWLLHLYMEFQDLLASLQPWML